MTFIGKHYETRWRVSLHESGHLIAARELLGDSGYAALGSSENGAAFFESVGIDLKNREQAIMLAAGQCAERLIEYFEAPSPPINTGNGSARFGLAAAAVARAVDEVCGDAVPDFCRISAWVKTSTGRFHGNEFLTALAAVYDDAEIFCARYAACIVQAAAALFFKGFLYEREPDMTKLTELLISRKLAARSEFLARAWADAPLEELLSLAEAAGIPPGDADEVIDRCARVKSDIAHAKNFESLKKAFGTATAEAAIVQTRVRLEIEKLEDEMYAANGKANAARDAFFECENAVHRVAAEAETLPTGVKFPPAVADALKRDAHQAEALHVGQRRDAARQKIETLRSDIRNLRLKRLSTREDELVAKESSLVETEAEYSKLAAAYEKLRA